ncbi:LysR family transcriptional regulator [Saccharopolyspora mangrovi]|uniref:LysR family transcriptional regulator n=1 Tax=Saccharopolyspora mangrovi TaxID=3082379 RepID=A0ABU6ADB4_9PSEU|nr:LysR family transcriptional regulator [Saccharopolyspora sp. S2-29]MEB3369548.1 LysR family transcriptional regulator [Saccharopolyspora sp. S2-29]
MDTDLLRTFLAVARHESFTAAATELNLVQSTVTSRIKGLEKALGTRLLDRLPDGARLTEAGRRAADHAHAVLDAERRLVEDTAFSEPAGEVVVGAPESVCAYRLPRAVAALRQQHPGIAVHLVPAGTRETFRGVLDGSFGLGLILDQAAAPNPLTLRRVGAEPIALVAAPDHPSTREDMTWPKLAEQSYFLLEEGCSYTDDFVRELERRGGTRPQITRFGSIEAARSCVEAGLGLSVLPEVSCADALQGHRLRSLPHPPRPDAPLAFVLDERRWRSPAVEAITRTITESFRTDR